jgi:small subunit ribosomal protein S2
MKQLLEAGVHFGHQTRRWNPKMAPFIFTNRNGIHIIDLQQTVTRLNDAYKFVEQTAAEGGTILFVGTKKQAQEAIAEEAKRCGMYYVNQRWLGGMLTNFQTIQSRIRYLRDLEARRDRGDFERLPKKEVQHLTDDMTRLERILGGIKDMRRLPTVLFIVDTRKERTAVMEALPSKFLLLHSQTRTRTPTRWTILFLPTMTRSVLCACCAQRSPMQLSRDGVNSMPATRIARVMKVARPMAMSL